MSGFNVQILLRLVDQLTGPSKRISQSYRDMQRNVTSASNGLNAATASSTAGFNRMSGAANTANASVSRLATNMRNLRTLSAGFTGLGLGGGGGAMMAGFPLIHMLKNAADYESKLIDIQKVWQGTESEYQKLVEGLKPLHAELPLSRIEIGKVLEEGIRSAVSYDPGELLDFTRQAAAFSVAFTLPIEEAAVKLAKIKSSLGLSMKEFTGVGDTMNTLANSMATSEGELLEFIRRVGGLAKSIGGMKGLDDVLAIGAAQMAAGTPKEVAATGLRTLLARLSTQPADTKKALKALGLDPKAIKKQLPDDIFGTVFELIDRISKAPKEQQSGLLAQLAGMRSFDAFARLLTSTDLMLQALKTVRGEFRLTMQSELIKRVNSLNSAFQITRNLLGDLSDSIVMAWRPQIMSFLRGLQGLSQSMKNSPILQWTAAAFAGLAALSLIALPFGILGASIFSVALSFRLLASAARKVLVPLRFLWRFSVGGLATALTGVGVGVATAVKAFVRATSLGWRFAGALGAVTMAWRGLRRALGIGLIIEGLLLVYEHWDKLKQLAKDPLKLEVLFPQAPDWLRWLVRNAEQQKVQMDQSMDATRQRVSGWLDGATNRVMRGDANDYGVGHWAPSFAGIGQYGVPDAIRRRPDEAGKSGSGQVGIGTQNVTTGSNNTSTVNVGGVVVNVTSNADPHAIGAATANAVGSKIRGALSDAPHSAP